MTNIHVRVYRDKLSSVYFLKALNLNKNKSKNVKLTDFATRELKREREKSPVLEIFKRINSGRVI